ncbi:MAG: class I SAM-dependent methyltransferase [Salinirussus sp.]
MTTWDERFRTGSYPTDADPSPVLREYLESIPDGRAMDVATGPGRNAVFLATHGYVVDALDQSIEGLRIARDRAVQQDAADRLNLIRADVPSYAFPTARYDLVTISFYRAADRLPDIIESLTQNGYLFMEHHLRSTESTPSGPSSDRYRFAANELLRSTLGLTVLYYDETTSETEDGKRRATARVLARRSSGSRQAYPDRPS